MAPQTFYNQEIGKDGAWRMRTSDDASSEGKPIKGVRVVGFRHGVLVPLELPLSHAASDAPLA